MLLNPRLKTRDMAVVMHPFLKDGVQARAYQMMALRNALAASTLMVMPTGFGKTAVEWMAMAESLRLNTGKILLLAPTTGLVEQQQRMAQDMLHLEPEFIVTYTGDIAPAKRPSIWNEARIIMATAQVIRNDVANRVIDLQTVDLLVVDEAHHGTGNHAYAHVGKMYLNARGSDALVLCATASPGSTENNIMEVIRNYGIERLDIARKESTMLQPYVVDMNIIPHPLELPETLTTLIEPIQYLFNQEAQHLQNLGFLSPTSHVSGKMIEDAQRRASQAIQRRDVRGYDAARRIGDLRRIHMLLDLIRTQGLKSSLAYLQRAEEDGRSGDRSTNRFVAKKQIHEFRIAAKEVPELHPKPGQVVTLIRDQIHQKPESKVIVFTEYRDTVDNLYDAIDSIDSARCDKFIGQSGKGKRKGMSQKQQLQQLKRFRDGDINVLIATSVGEEGLDVPAAELVILYEPVPSAIRAIQRRGRTARQQAGTVHTLIAKGTRDEYVNTAAQKREQRMHRLLQRIQNRGILPVRPPPSNDVFGSFSIQAQGDEITVPDFIEREKQRIDEMFTSEQVTEESKQKPVQERRGPPLIAPSERRHSQQMGLEQFMSKPESNETKTAALRTEFPVPILNAQDHRQLESEAVSAAQGFVESMKAVNSSDIHVIFDQREASSTLAPYLRSLGVEVNFEHLSVGDIRISERVLIERKTARDLVRSLTDGRLLDQTRRLKAAAARPLLLIEIGNSHDAFVHPNAVHGALAHVSLDLGVPVMMTKNSEESAHFLAAAAQREHDLIERLAEVVSERSASFDDQRNIEAATLAAVKEIQSIEDDTSSVGPLSQRWTHNSTRDAVEIVSAIPGIGRIKATALIGTFGSVAAIFAADIDQLTECEGIGKASALTVFEALHC